MNTSNINEAYSEKSEMDSLTEKISEGLSMFYDETLLTSEAKTFTSKNPEKITDYMQVFGSEEEKVYQLLRSMVKVGDEIISLVDILYTDNKGDLFSKSIITRYVPNNRAEFVTLINRGEEPVILGNSGINNVDTKIPHAHCQFSQDDSGNINYVNLELTNNAQVFVQKANSDGETMTDPRNPTSDFATWGFEPEKIKKILNIQ